MKNIKARKPWTVCWALTVSIEGLMAIGTDVSNNKQKLGMSILAWGQIDK